MLKGMQLEILLCVAICATGAQASEQSATTPQTTTRAPALHEQAQRLIEELAAEDYAVRESATVKLMEMGGRALPSLEKAEKSADPEVAWRAAAAARMIRLRIGPELWSMVAGLVEEFEEADPTGRERIVRILRTIGDKKAIPALRQVLRTDSSEPVKRAAAIMLADLGSEGLAVLMEEGVKIAGLDPYDAGVHVLIGNSFLNDGNYGKAQEHYMKALELEAANYIAMYNMACVRSLQKKIDQAIEWLRKAVDAGYDDFEWMEKDPDLDNIREDAGYKEILRKGPKTRERPPAAE